MFVIASFLNLEFHHNFLQTLLLVKVLYLSFIFCIYLLFSGSLFLGHQVGWSRGNSLDFSSGNAGISVRTPAVLVEVSRGLPQFLQDNTGLVP
jgi:hypothetical protein